MTTTFKAYSQRLTPPYSGQIQIVESERARAVSIDNETWEIHFLYGSRGIVNNDGKKPRGAVADRDFDRSDVLRGHRDGVVLSGIRIASSLWARWNDAQIIDAS